MSNYEPFYSKYTRVQYNDYKSEKLTTLTNLENELENALDNGFDDVFVTSYQRQPNGLYAGRKKRYYFKNGKWKNN
jgi:hypothetical protein